MNEAFYCGPRPRLTADSLSPVLSHTGPVISHPELGVTLWEDRGKGLGGLFRCPLPLPPAPSGKFRSSQLRQPPPTARSLTQGTTWAVPGSPALQLLVTATVTIMKPCSSQPTLRDCRMPGHHQVTHRPPPYLTFPHTSRTRAIGTSSLPVSMTKPGLCSRSEVAGTEGWVWWPTSAISVP
jgi:hypothetical protein